MLEMAFEWDTNTVGMEDELKSESKCRKSETPKPNPI